MRSRARPHECVSCEVSRCTRGKRLITESAFAKGLGLFLPVQARNVESESCPAARSVVSGYSVISGEGYGVLSLVFVYVSMYLPCLRQRSAYGVFLVTRSRVFAQALNGFVCGANILSVQRANFSGSLSRDTHRTMTVTNLPNSMTQTLLSDPLVAVQVCWRESRPALHPSCC